MKDSTTVLAAPAAPAAPRRARDLDPESAAAPRAVDRASGVESAMTLRALGWTTLSGGVLVLLFWAAYWSGVLDPGERDRIAHAYESAFPLADGVLAAALFAASRALLAGKPRGPFWLVIAAAMCLYLGTLDVTFYAGHGSYWPLSTAGLVQLLISLLTIGGGAVGLRAGWRLWSAG